MEKPTTQGQSEIEKAEQVLANIFSEKDHLQIFYLTQKILDLQKVVAYKLKNDPAEAIKLIKEVKNNVNNRNKLVKIAKATGENLPKSDSNPLICPKCMKKSHYGTECKKDVSINACLAQIEEIKGEINRSQKGRG